MAAVRQQDMFAYNNPNSKAAARLSSSLGPYTANGQEEEEEEALCEGGQSPSRIARVSARAGRTQQALLNKMPKQVSDDLKWFVWNEAWRVFNSLWREALDPSERDALGRQIEDNASRSGEHLQAVKAAGAFSGDFLEVLMSETAVAAEEAFGAFSQGSPLELPPPDAYEDLEPPEGVTSDFWVRLVKVVHRGAVTVNEQAAETELGERLMREFEQAWARLAEAPAAPRAGARGRPLAQPGRGRQAEPLNGMPVMHKTRGATAEKDQRNNAESEASDVEAFAPDFAPALLDHPPATGLCDSDGHPARVGSVGLWLESVDFVVACQEGLMTELASAFDIGAHGSVRQWPSIYKSEKNLIFKKLFCKGGPCYANKVKGVSTPDVNVLSQMSGSSLQRLQSFANARAVKAKLGYAIVKGWAIYDLLSMEVGEGYLAERYWWNTDGSDGTKGWVDFTPRPEGMRELVLAQAAEELPPRRMSSLQPEQLALAEGLLCLRCPEFVVARRAELGTRGAVDVALRHALQQAETRGDAVERRAMASACIRGVLLDHLSSEDENLPLMQELVSLLEVLSRVSQKDCVQERELQSLLEAGGIEALTSLTASEDTWIAATAASALACVCHGNPKVQSCARNAGAPRALAELFEREDIQRMDCYASEAVEALWQAEGRLAEQMWALPGQVKRDSRSQEHWDQLLELCNGDLRQEHRSQAPRARRGHSWGRVLAFAQVALGAHGINMRRGTTNQPFVIWVLGAEDIVEGTLAEEGFFDNANWVELGPTEVIIFGEGLRQLQVEREPRSGEPAVVRTASYREMPWLCHFGVPPPDLAAVLMPEVCLPGSRDKPQCNVPELALAAVSQVPVIISQRFGPVPDEELTYRRKLAKQLIMKHVRCPFSTSGGSSESLFDDNGWIFAVQGQGSLAKALQVEGAPEVVMPYVHQPSRRNKQPVVFWGILDIKYDTARPVLDRVKVLETGDGQTSKFSHDGADIKLRFEEKYQLDRSVDLDMQHVISADKKLTHDFVTQAEYGHVIPRQACFPRQYQPDLAKQIQEALNLTEDDKVVLKLCNRTRAAGVVISPVSELDDVLEDLLQPPKDLEAWFEDRLCAIMDVEGSPVDLGLGTSNSFEEQKRHWWSNESPVFVAEVWCKSVPTLKEGQPFDGTMRVAFALRRRQTSTPASSPDGVFEHQPLQSEPLEVTPHTLGLDWLGGYWKLPMSDMDSGSGSLREIVVSMAKASGTAPVRATHLMEVFAGLDDMVQQLYGRAEPSSAELAAQYQHHPELGAFVTARLGTWCHSRRPGFTKQMLDDADAILSPLPNSVGQSTVQAFIHRARGILELQQSVEGGPKAEDHFRTALCLLPTNANSLHLIGLRFISLMQPREAVKPLTRSLLLDPDYKGVYINLGLAYLRLHSWERCLEVSQAGQYRHPDAPQFHYHIAVSCCQMALAMVQESAVVREELIEAQAAAEKFEARRAALQEAVQKAEEEAGAAAAAKAEASKAKEEAKRVRNNAEAEAKRKPIEAGMKLRAKEDMVAIFPSLENFTTEIGQLRKRQMVTAAGSAIKIDGYTMLPIEPRGAVDLYSLELAFDITGESQEFEQASSALEHASNRWNKAIVAKKEAKRALEDAARKKVGTVPRRPVAKLLRPEQMRRYEQLRQASLQAFVKVRDHDLARGRRKGHQSPWLEVDDGMIDAMESAEGPVDFELPASIGWPSAQYRL